jgi:nucleophosmin 1
MTFWGCVLKPGQKKKIDITEADVLHLSQACLHEPAGGKNHLQVTAQGTTYSIAILEKDKKEHETFDLFFDSADTVFSCNGKSEIHLTGYIEPTDEGMEDSEEEDMAPRLPVKASPKASPKEAPKSSPKTAPVASPKKSPVAPPADDDEDDEEEEEEEEEEDAPPPPPAKKAKTDSPAKSTPASPGKTAPSSPKTGPATGAVIDTYVQKMVKFLKDNGQTNIGLLGSKVPRPEGAPKMKAVLEQHKDKFVVAGDKVTAK